MPCVLGRYRSRSRRMSTSRQCSSLGRRCGVVAIPRVIHLTPTFIDRLGDVPSCKDAPLLTRAFRALARRESKGSLQRKGSVFLERSGKFADFDATLLPPEQCDVRLAIGHGIFCWHCPAHPLRRRAATHRRDLHRRDTKAARRLHRPRADILPTNQRPDVPQQRAAEARQPKTLSPAISPLP